MLAVRAVRGALSRAAAGRSLLTGADKLPVEEDLRRMVRFECYTSQAQRQFSAGYWSDSATNLTPNLTLIHLISRISLSMVQREQEIQKLERLQETTEV